MKRIAYIAGAAVGIPLLLTLLAKLLGAVHSLLSKLMVVLLWLVSAAGGAVSLLYLYERRRGRDDSPK